MAELRVLDDRPVNSDALQLAEATVERIKSGEVIAVAIVEVRRERTVAIAYSRSDQYHLLNSGAARLANRIASEPED